jgi:ubiquinone/menaquinone biosynthesis C-methylase UbiE
VVDLGCGPGNKSVAWAEQSAVSVVGIDPEVERLARGRALASEKQLGNTVHFVACIGERLSIADASADVFILADVMEHLPTPTSVLRECARVLRPGGSVLIYFKTYFSPRGSHINDWIPIPWNHVLFRDETLIRVLKRMSERDPYVCYHFPSLRAPVLPRTLTELSDAGLNKITLQSYRRLITDAPLEIVLDELSCYRESSSPILRRLPRTVVSRWPFNEFLGSYVMTVLRRPLEEPR